MILYITCRLIAPYLPIMYKKIIQVVIVTFFVTNRSRSVNNPPRFQNTSYIPCQRYLNVRTRAEINLLSHLFFMFSGFKPSSRFIKSIKLIVTLIYYLIVCVLCFVTKAWFCLVPVVPVRRLSRASRSMHCGDVSRDPKRIRRA